MFKPLVPRAFSRELCDYVMSPVRSVLSYRDGVSIAPGLAGTLSTMQDVAKPSPGRCNGIVPQQSFLQGLASPHTPVPVPWWEERGACSSPTVNRESWKCNHK